MGHLGTAACKENTVPRLAPSPAHRQQSESQAQQLAKLEPRSFTCSADKLWKSIPEAKAFPTVRKQIPLKEDIQSNSARTHFTIAIELRSDSPSSAVLS